MKLEDQVVSLELAKKLKELGVKQDSYLYWNLTGYGSKWELKQYHQLNESEACAAFTVAELGEMLPVGVHSGKSGVGCRFVCKHRRKPLHFVADTEAEARAKMLIHLIERGLVKP